MSYYTINLSYLLIISYRIMIPGTSCFETCVSKENWPELKKNPTDAEGKVIEAERKWSMPLSGPWRHGSIKAGLRCVDAENLGCVDGGKMVEDAYGDTVIVDVFRLPTSQLQIWKMQGFLKQYVSEKKPVAECGSSDEQAEWRSSSFVCFLFFVLCHCTSCGI